MIDVDLNVSNVIIDSCHMTSHKKPHRHCLKRFSQTYYMFTVMILNITSLSSASL